MRGGGNIPAERQAITLPPRKSLRETFYVGCEIVHMMRLRQKGRRGGDSIEVGPQSCLACPSSSLLDL